MWRTVAALTTWSLTTWSQERDFASISLECSSATSVICSMSGISSQLEGVLHWSVLTIVFFNIYHVMYILYSGICLIISVITYYNTYFQDRRSHVFRENICHVIFRYTWPVPIQQANADGHCTSSDKYMMMKNNEDDHKKNYEDWRAGQPAKSTRRSRHTDCLTRKNTSEGNILVRFTDTDVLVLGFDIDHQWIPGWFINDFYNPQLFSVFFL